jgi:hypothetical protein
MPVEAIKTTLLPYLDALTKKEDDEVVFAITEEYATLAYPLPYPVPCSATNTPSSSPSCKIYAHTMRQSFGRGL